MIRQRRKSRVSLPLSLALLSAVLLLAETAGAQAVNPGKDPASEHSDSPADGEVAEDLLSDEPQPAPPPDPSDEVAYRIWSAELLGGEGQLEKAASEYLGAALMSEDPEVAERATEAAISAQSWQVASMAADRWVQLAPDSLRARETATRALLVGGDYVRAELQLLAILTQTEAEAWGGWTRLPQLLVPARNVERTLELLDHLAEERGATGNPYFHYSRSRAIARSGDFEAAQGAVNTALELAPDEAPLHAWAGRLAINQRQEEAAIGHYRQAWQLDPANRSRAMTYAELLRQAGLPDDANDVLKSLPETPENRFARVAFATESGNRTLAVDLYEGFRDFPYSDDVERAFHAARSAEVLELKEDAIGWYQQLEGSQHNLIAVVRSAVLLSELGRLDEARSLMVAARNSGKVDVQLETTLVEAQLLAEANQPEAAFAMLEKGLAQFPDDTRLLYTRALIAVQLDRIGAAETDLRAILAREPANAAALNALGYTLADRTDRYEEAEQLIRQAFEIEPEDPAIIDSMGWVAFRQGRLDEAERFLRQALLRQRNAEIAAHLGEVLWAQGREDEARRIWNEALRIDPSDKVLLETLERFGVEL
ncbi:MAG: tetratricopeptide repeat protein [Pseudomonadota bacterium]